MTTSTFLAGSVSDNARIEFGAVEKEAKTVYFVKDNGDGFDPGYVEKMFMPFQRLHSEECQTNIYEKIPMTAPVMQVARVPATSAFMPSATTSSLRSGARLPRPPIRMPRLPKLAKLLRA
jgi:hypothetical protein